MISTLYCTTTDEGVLYEIWQKEVLQICDILERIRIPMSYD
jgi:hypothetical protein